MKCPDFLFWTVSKYLVGCNTICPDESHGLASKSIMTKKTPNNELGVSLVKTEITGRPASNYPNVVSETKLNLWPDSVGQDQLARPGKVWSLGHTPIAVSYGMNKRADLLPNHPPEIATRVEHVVGVRH